MRAASQVQLRLGIQAAGDARFRADSPVASWEPRLASSFLPWKDCSMRHELAAHSLGARMIGSHDVFQDSGIDARSRFEDPAMVDEFVFGMMLHRQSFQAV